MDYGYVISKQTLGILDIMPVLSYNIKLDSEYAGKSTVETARSPGCDEGDYFFIKNSSGTIYIGLVDSVDNSNGETAHTINLLEIHSIFDRKIYIDSEGLISSSGMEDFIKHEIEREFSQSDDDFLNLAYIDVVVETHTPIDASVDTDNGIFNFLTFLGNAREYYGIFLDFAFTADKLTITYTKKEQETLRFDSTVTYVCDYEETYSVDALAKLTAIWKAPDEEDDDGNTIVGDTTILTRYLKTDRTTTDDASDPDRASGTIDMIYVETDTEEEVLTEIANQFKNNAYNHSVTANVRRASLIYPEEAFYIGHECQIKTVSHGIKDSLITALEYSSDSEYVSVKFGNMAITLLEKLRKER